MSRERKPRGRPPTRLVKAPRMYVALTLAMSEQVRQLAAEERRPITAQVEILLERGLRSYGLEASAA